MKTQEKFMMACELGEVAVVEDYLQAGLIDINQCSDTGWAPLHLACNEQNDTLLTLLLAQNDIKINLVGCYGYTSLHIACEQGDENMVRLLLSQKNLDPNLRDDFGRTALYIACDEGYDAIVALLLTKNLDVDINQATKQGSTPLYIACCEGHESVVDLLLTHPDILADQANHVGETPLAISLLWQNPAIARKLVEQLTQAQVEIQPLKPLLINQQMTSLMALAENYPEISEMFNAMRHCTKEFAIDNAGVARLTPHSENERDLVVHPIFRLGNGLMSQS